MGLRRPHAFPSLDWSPSHSQILHGWATTRDFRIGRDLLVSSHPPHASSLQWAYAIPLHSLHLGYHHPTCKFCAVCQQRAIFVLDTIPSFPVIHLVPARCNGSTPSPHISFTQLVAILFANSARFGDNA